MMFESIVRRNIEVRSSFGFGTTIPRAWPRRMIVAFEIRDSCSTYRATTAWAA
jgi:hypothetical protein